MSPLSLFTFLLIVTFVVSVPVNPDYEVYADGGSNVQANNNDQLYDNDDESDYYYTDIKSETGTIRYKREDSATEIDAATKRPTFSLSDVIGKVESSIVQSALQVSSLLTPGNNSTINSHEQIGAEQTETPKHAFEKRSATTTVTEIRPVTETVDTHYNPPQGNQPEHISIDHFSIFKAGSGGFPLFTLAPINIQKPFPLFTEPPLIFQQTLIPQVQKQPDNIQSSSKNTQSQGTDLQKETIKDIVEPIASQSNSQPATTEKSAIVELQKTEQKLIEQAAEIEATPVILSARV